MKQTNAEIQPKFVDDMKIFQIETSRYLYLLYCYIIYV